MKQRLLIILTPGFPENEADSTCLPPQQIFVRALKEAEPDLHIVVLSFQYPFFTGEYQWYGIRVMAFGHRGSNRLLRRLTGFRVLMALRRLHRQFNIIGMLSFWLGKCAYTGSWFAKRNGLMHYTWLLGQDARAGNKYFIKTKPDAASLIALSDFLRREFARNYGLVPAHTIPVGIEAPLFKAVAGTRDIDVLGAGSLIPLKQYHVFLEVVSVLKVSFPNIKTVICGDGPEKKRLMEMVTRLGLTSNVSFTGMIPHQKVLALMQRARVFVHPSSYEGFGAVCLEALYAGASVVSFVKPMDAEIENWFIARDKAAMHRQVEKVLSDNKSIPTSVLPYPIADNAAAMLRLFGQPAAPKARIFPAMASKESVLLK